MFNFIHNPTTKEIGSSLEDFLSRLNGPGCIILDGEDNSRTRVYVTLQHGNEPSGVMALFRWLQEGRRPKVRIVCLLVSVETALQAPMFHYRSMPGVRDVNRCYQPPFNDVQGQLAKNVLDIIHQYQPEAVIDVHNTSGSGPAFGVATHRDPKHEALTIPFSNKLVITHLKLGALMDISEESFPTVTIEAGGRLEQSSHDAAWQGLEYYFTEEDVLKLHKPEWEIDILMEPIRIELKPKISLSYASTANTEFDVTLKNNLDQLNFTQVSPDTPLGWVNRGGLNNFNIQDYKHQSTTSDWLQIKGQQLYLTQSAELFMITTDPVIAIDDCLFYLVKTPNIS